MVAEDLGSELGTVKSIRARARLVKIVRPMVLGVFAEGVHLKVHASVNVTANRRVVGGVLGREPVNEHHRRESILSGSVGEYVGGRDFGLSDRFGERAGALSQNLRAIRSSWYLGGR